MAPLVQRSSRRQISIVTTLYSFPQQPGCHHPRTQMHVEKGAIAQCGWCVAVVRGTRNRMSDYMDALHALDALGALGVA